MIWSEINRPKKISELILPKRIQSSLENSLQNFPNMLFSGPPGSGKTSAARAFANEYSEGSGDVLFINASKERNIETLRGKITDFASSQASVSGKYKIVILDEADYLNPQSTQPALRSDLEEFSENCRFILTANYPSKILGPLLSRLTHIEFKFTPEEIRICNEKFILRFAAFIPKHLPGFTFTKEQVQNTIDIISKYSPDFRKCWNELQNSWNSSQFESIQNSSGSNLNENYYSSLVKYIKEKNFESLVSYIQNTPHSDDSSEFISKFYSELKLFISDPKILPEIILLFNTYDVNRVHISSEEIHKLALCVQIMKLGILWK